MRLLADDQIVRINGTNTAHSTGDFHPRMRHIFSFSTELTFLVKRGHTLQSSPPLIVYDSTAEVPVDGVTFVACRNAAFPTLHDVTPRMIWFFSECYTVSLEEAEIELRSMDELTKQSWTVNNWFILEF